VAKPIKAPRGDGNEYDLALFFARDT